MNIGVLGAGSWGTTLAIVLEHNHHNVTMWSYSKDDAASMRELGFNQKYLPGITISGAIEVTTDLQAATEGKDILLVSTPAQFVRSVLSNAVDTTQHLPYIVNVAKGIENGSLQRMSEVVADVLPHIPGDKYAVLSGPSHAEEVSRGKATSVVVASASQETSVHVQEAFSTSYFRIYSSQDVTGVELGGSLKNVIAIGAGICDGGDYGDNTKAALITRGIAEIRRLGVALGAEPQTFAGLSGLGDLIVTTMSRHSRNRYVGEELGKGRKLDEIISNMDMIAEGVETTKSAYNLALRHSIEMPIIQEVYNILFKGKDPQQATYELMTRQLKDETWS